MPAERVYQVTARRRPTVVHRADVAAGESDVDFVLPGNGKLWLRLIDKETKESVRQLSATMWPIEWRRSGTEESWGLLWAKVDLEGLVESDLPVGEVDLYFPRREDGYVPLMVHGILVSKEQSEPVLIEGQPGCEVKLELVGEGELRRRNELFFLVEESQRSQLRGPFPADSGLSNHRIDGVHMWLGEKGLIDQMLGFHDGSTEVIQGLAPGTYSVVAFPSGHEFEPASFVLESGRTEIELSWRLP